MKINFYKSTTVSYMKTQLKVDQLLRTFEITNTRWTNLEDQLIFEFNKKIENKSIGIRIIIKGINDKNRNQMYRILFHYLKTKLEFISCGLVEFLQEFMPHLVVYNDKNESITLYQQLECVNGKILIGTGMES